MKKQIKCVECKHYVDEEDIIYIDFCSSGQKRQIPYCPTHKRGYSRVHSFYPRERYYKTMEVEVDKDGNEVDKDGNELPKFSPIKNTKDKPALIDPTKITIVCILTLSFIISGLLYLLLPQ